MNLKLNPEPFAAVAAPVSQEGRYQPVAFWQETVDIVPGPPLSGAVEADIAIVGGGFTGLSTAIHLKRFAPDLNIVLIERGVCGHGASGRNGGFAMPLIGWDLVHCVRSLGETGAAEAWRLMYRAVDHLKRFVAEEGIACDLEATGYVLIASCAARERRMRREYALGHAFGFDHVWLDRRGLEDYIRCPQFRCGVFDPHPCIINPAKLARGLKSVAEQLGVQIHEQTPMTALHDGATLRLSTPGGEVRARQVLLALNGYGASVGFMASRILPVHTYIVLTEPLTRVQLEAIGWAKRRASLETARNFIHYFRLTADNRIAFGGEDADLYYGGRYRDGAPAIFEALKARFRAFFPVLRDVQFTHAWGGVLGVTLDMFPTFGRGGEHRNIFHACGYSGHGVALSNYAGAILAPEMLAALGRNDAPKAEADTPFFFGRTPQWLPPDPLRWVGMQAYRRLLRLQDGIEGA
jgi:glycine/D-amino acid oxidase-like deaminating enzyme